MLHGNDKNFPNLEANRNGKVKKGSSKILEGSSVNKEGKVIGRDAEGSGACKGSVLMAQLIRKVI